MAIGANTMTRLLFSIFLDRNRLTSTQWKSVIKKTSQTPGDGKNTTKINQPLIQVKKTNDNDVGENWDEGISQCREHLEKGTRCENEEEKHKYTWMPNNLVMMSRQKHRPIAQRWELKTHLKLNGLSCYSRWPYSIIFPFKMNIQCIDNTKDQRTPQIPYLWEKLKSTHCNSSSNSKNKNANKNTIFHMLLDLRIGGVVKKDNFQLCNDGSYISHLQNQ